MGSPKVWNLRVRGYPKNGVYCGRGSPYGNPYIAGQHGSRDMVCDKFEKHVLPELDVSELEGHDLLCWCAPQRCHCDSIFRKANGYDWREGPSDRQSNCVQHRQSE